MSELKPCPFCGGEAEYVYGDDNEQMLDMWSVSCSNAKCEVIPCTLSYHTKEEAAAAWNTRHVETCTIERNESGCNFAYRLYTLSCGHTVWTMGDAPNYCMTCGKKVEG